MKELLVSLIAIYQKMLSPDHSIWGKQRFPHGYCRFYPSCSQYSRLALLEYGFLKGMVKSFWRILRCNPFSRGGFDPVREMGVKGVKG